MSLNVNENHFTIIVTTVYNNALITVITVNRTNMYVALMIFVKK